MLQYYSKLGKLKWITFFKVFSKLVFKCKTFLQTLEPCRFKLPLLNLHLTFTANEKNLYILWYWHSKKISWLPVTAKSCICTYLWALILHFLSEKIFELVFFLSEISVICCLGSRKQSLLNHLILFFGLG